MKLFSEKQKPLLGETKEWASIKRNVRELKNSCLGVEDIDTQIRCMAVAQETDKKLIKLFGEKV